MKLQLIKILAALIAGAIVMILHELPKSVLFTRLNSLQSTENKFNEHKFNIYKVFQYIDPIGIILCVVNQVGFSRPYMFRIKDRKTNFILGITGFISLLFIFLMSMGMLKYGIGMSSDFSYSETLGTMDLLYQCIILYIALISFSMIIVNLFPVSIFDMGLIIAGKSPRTYFSIIKLDYVIKIILLIAIILQLIRYFSTITISILL